MTSSSARPPRTPPTTPAVTPPSTPPATPGASLLSTVRSGTIEDGTSLGATKRRASVEVACGRGVLVRACRGGGGGGGGGGTTGGGATNAMMSAGAGGVTTAKGATTNAARTAACVTTETPAISHRFLPRSRGVRVVSVSNIAALPARGIELRRDREGCTDLELHSGNRLRRVATARPDNSPHRDPIAAGPATPSDEDRASRGTRRVRACSSR